MEAGLIMHLYIGFPSFSDSFLFYFPPIPWDFTLNKEVAHESLLQALISGKTRVKLKTTGSHSCGVHIGGGDLWDSHQGNVDEMG